MADEQQGFIAQSVHTTNQALDLIARLFRVSEPGVIFGAPVTQGDRTLLVASEVVVGMGVGVGGTNGDTTTGASAGGGGGGGYSFGRPVAIVDIGPQGVNVTPIVDSTKIAVAFFTTAGAMFFAWSRMRRASRS